jgi:hypothetical protein
MPKKTLKNGNITMVRKCFLFGILALFVPLGSFARPLDQKTLINEVKAQYARVASYRGELEIVKNAVHEKASLEFTPGRTVLRYTLGPKAGEELVVKRGVLFKEVFGIKMPIPITSKVFREANGDMGPGYVIARLNEEMERVESGVPIKTEVEDSGDTIVIRSDYTGKEAYRYRHAEVTIDKKLLLPIRAAYDTVGDRRFNEVYRFSFSDLRFIR